MSASLYAYAGLLVAYRAIELFTMRKTGSLKLKGRWRKDWSIQLILIPWVLVIVAPVVEYLRLGSRPGCVSWTLGILLLAGAVTIRTRALFDLRGNFSPFIETTPGQELVTTGLYEHIRHPLYLGTLLFFIACPLLLAARAAWVFSAMGLVGIIFRIRIEERFLTKNLEGYGEYIKKTSAFIPGVF